MIHGPGECRRCGKPTREGKEHCSDHVFNQPYVAAMLRDLARRDDELSRVEAGEVPDPSGPAAEEFIQRLEEAGGEASIDKIMQASELSDAGARRVLMALEQARRVDSWINHRRKVIVRLLRPEDPALVILPVEIHVGECRLVALVPSRVSGSGAFGLETTRTVGRLQGPRAGKLRPGSWIRVRPFTRLLTRERSRLTLWYLQQRRADRIPEKWFTPDPRVREEAILDLRRAGFFPREEST